MSSSYPPPPNSSIPSEAGQQQPDPAATVGNPILDQQQVVTTSYDATPSPIAGTDPIVHHGLQALQAATAGSSLNPQQQQQQQQHHLPPQQTYTPITPQYAPHTPTGPPMAPFSLSAAASKATRLRRACDMCSRRKVKCDDIGPPCTPCKELNLECTRHREMKRRGPPNKHAEAAKLAKRPRLEPHLSPSPSNAAEALVSISAHESPASLDAEMIAPYPVLILLVDDFFTYIHPLIPFPHEPSFRQSFINREDRTSREYLALLASMIGCLVASFPRSAREHLKSLRDTNLFPRSITLIDRCRAVAMEARGVGFDNKRDMTVYDAATSYFLGLAAGYTFQWQLFRRFMGQTLIIIRETGHHTKRDGIPSYAANFIAQQAPKPVDHIKEEVGKRVFWVMFVSVRSMSQLGVPNSELLIPPQTAAEPYPDLPAEVDDQCILAAQILPQPEGTVSLLKGFNECLRIYLTMGPIVSAELCYGIGNLPWNHQRSMINDGLRDAKQITLNLPVELQLAPMVGSIPHSDSDLEDAGYQYCPPAFPALQPPDDIRHVIAEQPAKRRKIQFEIQKANIFVSQLATRSYYVEKYFNLHDAWRESHKTSITGPSHTKEQASNGTTTEEPLSPETQETNATDASMLSEREIIVQNLITVLASISQRNFEPNGASVINKIRQVASTLLNDRPERKGPVAQKAEEYLGQFLGILMKLERTGGSGMAQQAGGEMSLEDEEEELRVWADLREYQLRFAAAGGFLGEGGNLN